MQLREAQMQDLELKTIIDLLENLSKVQRKKGLIGYRMKDTVLYYADENETNLRIVVGLGPKHDRALVSTNIFYSTENLYYNNIR